jgi:CRISPR type III-A/MTUBE-associated protein Csm6
LILDKHVLFTCVGNTDPIRDNFDGPVLHIIRYYKPHKVYMFFSDEMGRREKKDNRYSRSIELLAEHLGIKVKIEKIFSEIKDPHNFDAYINVFSYLIKDIRSSYPDDTILLNISSGTPQMIATLCLETVIAEGKILPVQVETPAKQANRSRPVGEDYDIELEFQNNLDNEPESENRCLEPDIMSFKKTLLDTQIKALIDNYNYQGAKTLLRNFYPLPNELVMKLVDHCIYRFELKTDLSSKIISEIDNIDLFPVKDTECRKICEYLNILNIYQKTGDLAGFFLRLNPFIERMQTLFLETFCDFKISKVIERARNNELWVNVDKVREVNMELAEKLKQKCYINPIHNAARLNIRLQNIILEHIMESNDSLRKGLMQWFNFFILMEKLNQEFRNPLAHEIWGITEKEVEAAGNITCEGIIKRLKELILILFKNKCKAEIFKIYEVINEKIMEGLIYG